MKKILFTVWGGDIGERSPYDPWFIAGGELAAKWKAEGLGNYEWEPYFFTVSKRDFIGEINGVRIYQALTPNPPELTISKRQAYFQEKLQDFIQQIQPEIIYSRGVIPTSTLVVPIARQLRVPVIVAVDDQNFFDYFNGNRDDDHVRQKIIYLFENAQGITVQHSGLRIRIQEQFHVTCPISVVPPGIMVDKFQAKKPCQSKFTANGTETLVFVSRLAGSKRQDLLIESLPQILSSCPNIRVLLAGNGEYRHKLEEMVRNKKLGDNVTFLGKIENDVVPALLHSADILVFLSNREGFPTVMLEYLAAGKPIIASNIPPCNHLIKHNENGFLVENRADDIAEKIIKILSVNNRLEIGQKNMELAYHFDIAITIKKLNEFLKELV